MEFVNKITLVLVLHQFLVIKCIKPDLLAKPELFKIQTQNLSARETIILSKHDPDPSYHFNAEEIDAAVKYGFNKVEDLLLTKEPEWVKMGLYLDEHDPASKVAEFGRPNRKAFKLSQFGLATLEATKFFFEKFPENISREFTNFPRLIKSRMLEDDCPLKGHPRCSMSSKRYRTADGVCNNLIDPWKGAAVLPMQRFLSPVYEDGIQSIRRSVLGTRLPSARDISSNIHNDVDNELTAITLMFMQWGQFIDHDITSTVKSRSFNGSVPRCCDRMGRSVLPEEFLHPSCLPIEISEDDLFFGKFGIRCMEFLRSAPSTRLNCDLGWREQINQVSSFIDASVIYGSDIDTLESIRTFRGGKLLYGRPHGHRPLHPPDPPGGELCSSGVLTSDCFQPGDGRVMEQPGLTAFHTVWIRFHNQVASKLARFNIHWSDEKIYQETRKIVYSLIQHITYNEFLPILLGPEVMSLFELQLLSKGFFRGYDPRVNPAIANSFSTAAYRFGHSMVQNSFVRTDEKHRPIFNNVSLHDEFSNFENIWSLGSVDRTLLGFSNQPAQRRDEFVCNELSNHLFQSGDIPFGMDLTAINIQRGRDHGLPPYTTWREPCGLTPINNWEDLRKVFSAETARRFRQLYRHVDDIDLFSGGLAERPVRGAVVGPVFACIIAQQFSNLRIGDRFWYENGNFPSSFTPAQLHQIRKVTFSNVLCHTMDEIETIQPFVFLAPDNAQNRRLYCTDPTLKHLDLMPWIETDPNELDNSLLARESTDLLNDNTNTRFLKPKNKRKRKPSTTVNTNNNIFLQNNRELDERRTTSRPIEVNIKIQYFNSRSTTQSPADLVNQKLPTSSSSFQEEKPILYPVFIEAPNAQSIYNPSPSTRPTIIMNRPNGNKPTFVVDRPTNNHHFTQYDYKPYHLFAKPTADSYQTPIDKPHYPNYYDEVIFEDKPFTSNSKKPYKPNTNHFLYNDVYTTRRPVQNVYEPDQTEYDYENLDSYNNKGVFSNKFSKPTKVYSSGYVHRVDSPEISDKLDFKSHLVNKFKDKKSENKFVKISSIKSQASVSSNSAIINTVLQREGDADIGEEQTDLVRLVDMEVVPSDIDEKNWLIYNASEDTVSNIDVPSIQSVISSNEEFEEIPKPFLKHDEK